MRDDGVFHEEDCSNVIVHAGARLLSWNIVTPLSPSPSPLNNRWTVRSGRRWKTNCPANVHLDSPLPNRDRAVEIGVKILYITRDPVILPSLDHFSRLNQGKCSLDPHWSPHCDPSEEKLPSETTRKPCKLGNIGRKSMIFLWYDYSCT